MTEQAIKKTISEGEGASTEFKEAASKVPKSFYESVCSFLNRNGGIILLGVNDNGVITGVDEAEAVRMIDDIITTTNGNTKIKPSFMLTPVRMNVDGKTVIYTYVPVGSQIYQCNGEIFDRHGTADIRVTDPQQIKEMFDRKNTTFTEAKVYPALKIADLDANLFEKMKPYISLRNPNDPWLSRTPEQILRDAGFYKVDYHTGKEGLTLAAALIFGTEQVIRDIVPNYRVDLLVRKEDTNRYDDRLIVQCNLIESYGQIMEFISRHLPDKFNLEGITRIDLRAKIFREVIANLIVHREYTSRVSATVYIYNDRVEVVNGNHPFYNSRVDLNTYSAHQKNPLISTFFRHLGWVEEIGSGLNNIRHYSGIYTPNATPEFYDEEHFRAVIPIPSTKAAIIGKVVGRVLTLEKVIAEAESGGANVGVIVDVNGGISVRINGVDADALNGAIKNAIDEAVDGAIHGAITGAVVRRIIKELIYIIFKGGITLDQLKNKFVISRRTAQRDMQLLKGIGLVTFEGTPKTGKYVITEKAKQIKVLVKFKSE